jgi:class 3 adenylate cyclase
VAILFSDMRDFTGLSEKFAAATVVEMLNAYFSEWDRVSQRHGGIIDKFIGDAVMIVFESGTSMRNPPGTSMPNSPGTSMPNSPGTSMHPADGAVACAFEMLAGLERLRAHVAERGLPNPRGIGVGIAYGPVIMGNIGSARRRNYTVIGDFVNTASRLESACKEFGKSLIVSEAVFQLLQGPLRARFSPLGEISLKGKADRLAVYGA